MSTGIKKLDVTMSGFVILASIAQIVAVVIAYMAFDVGNKLKEKNSELKVTRIDKQNLEKDNQILKNEINSSKSAIKINEDKIKTQVSEIKEKQMELERHKKKAEDYQEQHKIITSSSHKVADTLSRLLVEVKSAGIIMGLHKDVWLMAEIVNRAASKFDDEVKFEMFLRNINALKETHKRNDIIKKRLGKIEKAILEKRIISWDKFYKEIHTLFEESNTMNLNQAFENHKKAMDVFKRETSKSIEMMNSL